MNNKTRRIITYFLLITAIVISYVFPNPKYENQDMLSNMNIPLRAGTWISRDASEIYSADDLRYNSITKVFARNYINFYNENLLFLILDAGNFHNPKVCFGSSGYKTKDLPDTELQAGAIKIKAKTVYFEKDREGFVVIYWFCINKKQVDWAAQKLAQLWSSLINKKKVGFMVRLDIPATEETTSSAVKLAREFIRDISASMPSEQAEYIFGK